MLQRHESLASNLGARLVGPMLLKSIEKLFEGPIRLIKSYGPQPAPVSWYDIVVFAGSHSSELTLTEGLNGEKTCQFWIKGSQVEISEDDYRLIMSGGPQRMLPSLPVPEDEAAEMATLNILEARLAVLIKKADAVASKARQLNYHLKGHKVAIQAGRNYETESSVPPNVFPHSQAAHSPPPLTTEVAKIQQDLLHQFTSSPTRHRHDNPQPKYQRTVNSQSPGAFQGFNPTQAPSNNTALAATSTTSRQSPYHLPNSGDDDPYRVFMSAKIEKLNRGDVIHPPCDRCRRLKYDCTKHLSACSPCTKKHAKCSWKEVKNDELYGYSASPAAKGESDYKETGTTPIPSPGQGAASVEGGGDINENGTVPTPANKDKALSIDNVSDNVMDENTMLSRIASAAASAGQK